MSCGHGQFSPLPQQSGIYVNDLKVFLDCMDPQLSYYLAFALQTEFVHFVNGN